MTEPSLVALALGLQVLFNDRPEPDQHVSVLHLDLRGRDLLLELLKEGACLFDGNCPGSPVPHALASFRRIWPNIGAEKPSLKLKRKRSRGAGPAVPSYLRETLGRSRSTADAAQGAQES